MTEPPGIPSVLGIESVEWLAEGGENVTVRVTGRWRRRRPAWSAQPVLVVEAAGRRFRFPAMPEPPSLTGTGPGMWRISFAVPAALAPELGGRTWLQVGAVVVPLPSAVQPFGSAASEAEPLSAPEPGTSDEAAAGPPSPPTPPGPPGPPSPPSSEVEVERARRGAREAEDAVAAMAARVRDLETELGVARREAQRFTGQLEEGERTRRSAEQRAHAEQALRRDLARQLAARDRNGERARERLAAAEERVRELEADLRDARRRGDEAEQLAAAAVAARQRAERQPEKAHPAAPQTDAALKLERALVQERATVVDRVPAEPSPAPVAPAPAPEPAPASGLVPALRRELQASAAAGAAVRARLLQAEASLAARPLIERRTSEILGRLRHELDGLRSAFERERAARVQAERRAEELARELGDRRQRTEGAQRAIAELRQALASLAVEPDPPQPPEDRPQPPEDRPQPPEAEATRPQPSAGATSAAVEPERLNDARQRLRAAIAPRGPETDERTETVTATATRIPDDERTERSWLAPIWSSLARADPVTAGRLLIELLPGQGEAYPHSVAYDLVFGEGRGCAQVTVSDGTPAIRHADGPRPREEADFHVLGSPTAIARMLTAGAFRRRFGRGIARVGGRRGRRDRVEALRSLPAVRLDLRGLHRIGVRFEPELALRLVALMIDPSWTAREQFAVAYAVKGGPTWYLLVRGGAPVQVTADAPAGRVATTIEVPADAAALVLSGERTDEVMVTGEDWPLALLRKWIKRAQSG